MWGRGLAENTWTNMQRPSYKWISGGIQGGILLASRGGYLNRVHTQVRWFSRQSHREAEQHEWWPKATQGRPTPTGSSLLRSCASRDGQAGRLGSHEAATKDTQIEGKSQGGLPGSTPLSSGGSHGSQAGKLDRINGGQRNSGGSESGYKFLLWVLQKSHENFVSKSKSRLLRKCSKVIFASTLVEG